MILLQALLICGIFWAVTHAWQYGGERNWPGFARTELYFWLHVMRLGSIALTALFALAVIIFARTVLHTVIHAACSI